MTIERVAITQRIVEAATYVERRDAIAHDWYAWMRRNLPAAALLPVPNEPDGVSRWLDVVRPQAIILSSGNNWNSYTVRDRTELAMVNYAIKDEIPLLGVCRGLQVLNVHFGGTLLEQVERRAGAQRHVAENHSIKLEPAWARLLSAPLEFAVNSYHDQGVSADGLAADLRVFATSDDGLVEGAYHPSKPILGVQWHPERDHPSQAIDGSMVLRLFEQGAFWGRL